MSVLTPEEQRVFELSGELANAYFALTEEHPAEKAEVAVAIHVIQNKLMARPTRRALRAEEREPFSYPSKVTRVYRGPGDPGPIRTVTVSQGERDAERREREASLDHPDGDHGGHAS